VPPFLIGVTMKTLAYDIADDLISQVQQRYPHLRGDALTSMALLRACDLLSGLYSPESTESLPGHAGASDPRSDRDVPPSSVSRGRGDLTGSFSVESSVTCPNCDTSASYTEYTRTHCVTCGYSE